MGLDNTKRICLWSGPRNISTAFMYAFAQREDTVVYDEPLYGYYLKESVADAYHPGALEVLQNMELDGDKVVQMMLGPQPKSVAFFKQMTHHLLDLDRGFMQDMEHLILTRDPRFMLPSFAKEIPNPTMQDVGYEAHLELIQYLESIGKRPIIIDSKKLLMNPEKFFLSLCDALNLTYHSRMLHWQKGGRSEDGPWAKYWYKSVHASNGFLKYEEKEVSISPDLKPLLKRCIPIYEQLIQRSFY